MHIIEHFSRYYIGFVSYALYVILKVMYGDVSDSLVLGCILPENKLLNFTLS